MYQVRRTRMPYVRTEIHARGTMARAKLRKAVEQEMDRRWLRERPGFAWLQAQTAADDLKRSSPHKVRTPPIAQHWTRLSRWTERFRCRWRRPAHKLRGRRRRA